MHPTELQSYPALVAKCVKAKLVLPTSPLKPTRLCIIGESLGADEELEGDYFVGKAGGLLNKLLADLNIPRSSIYITNVCKVRPPANKMDRLYELGLSTADFLPMLKEELSIVQPKAILAVGNLALQVLTHESGITKWRGSLMECKLTPEPYPLIPTLHPAYLLRGQLHLYPYVRHDIKTWAKLAFGIKPKDISYEQIINPTFTQAFEFLKTINATSTSTCFDIETVGHQRITCIGWTLNPNSAICIPFRHSGLKLRWSEAEQIMLLNEMRSIFQNPRITKIAQNMHYDLHFLLPLLGFPREPLFDTMYAHWLIHPDAKHDLGFLTSVYTSMPYHKDEFKDWQEKSLPHDQTLWEYNIKDVIATHRVQLKLRQDLLELGLYDFFVGYIMPFRRVLFEMEHRGLRVDTALRNSWIERIESDELPDVLWHIAELTGQELNPNSSKQIGDLLYYKLKIPVPKTAAGNWNLDEKKLHELSARYPQYRQLFDLILCARTLKAKDLGTYLKAKLSPDGRMRCSYGTTVTGRLNSKSNFRNEGTNLQNQPKKFRKLFLPEPGHVFVEPDLRQAEAMVMAYLMESDKLKQVFASGKKIHSEVARWIFGEDVTPAQYKIAKQTVHGSNYHMGERKFATLIGRPVAEAKAIRAKYFAVVPELQRYHQEIRSLISTERRLTTPYGRTRVFTGRIDDETFRSGYAQIPQSTVVDTINIGLLGFWLTKPDEVYIATQTHDSVLISTPPELVETINQLIKLHLETLREIEIKGDVLTIPVDIDGPKETWLK